VIIEMPWFVFVAVEREIDLRPQLGGNALLIPRRSANGGVRSGWAMNPAGSIDAAVQIAMVVELRTSRQHPGRGPTVRAGALPNLASAEHDDDTSVGQRRLEGRVSVCSWQPVAWRQVHSYRPTQTIHHENYAESPRRTD